MILNICGFILGFKWSTNLQSPLDLLGMILILASFALLFYSVMCRTDRI